MRNTIQAAAHKNRRVKSKPRAETWPAVLLRDLAADQWLKRKPVLRGILSILGYTFLSGGSLRKQILVHHNFNKRGDSKETGTMCLTLSACYYLLTKEPVFAKSSSVKPEEALKQT